MAGGCWLCKNGRGVYEFMNKNNIYRVYVDGSYNAGLKVGAYAFVVVDDNNMVVHRDCGVVVHVGLLAGHHIGCECKAVVEALKWCVSRGIVCDIYYDLVNLRSWVQDLWNEKPWRTNMDYSQAYRYYVLNNRQHLRNMIPVKSHAGDYFNEMVDTMCGECYIKV